MTAVPLTDQQLADIRAELDAALSEAGAFCGECGFEPGETGCPDCVRARARYVDAVMPLIDRLTAELEQARQQTEAAHCRLHFIAERVGRLDISEDPTGVAGDVGPYLDGPLHPLDLADYRAAVNSATPVEICEIPHATVEEEDACEQQRLAQATQSSA